MSKVGFFTKEVKKFVVQDYTKVQHLFKPDEEAELGIGRTHHRPDIGLENPTEFQGKSCLLALLFCQEKVSRPLYLCLTQTSDKDLSWKSGSLT